MTISTRAEMIIEINGTAIPAAPGTQNHTGFLKLVDCDGKPYQAFRDMAGGVKGSPGRLFSPSTVIKLAEKTGFARLRYPASDVDALTAAGFRLTARWTATDAPNRRCMDLDAVCPNDAGVYAFVVAGNVRYVGSAQSGLHGRFRRYATTSTMRTSARVRDEVLACLSQGQTVEIYTLSPPAHEWNGLPVDLIAGLEEGLIRSLRPVWNRRSNRDPHS